VSSSVQCSSGKSECNDIDSIKKILENQPKGKRAEELPRAIWSHNTSVYRATKFTSFKLLYSEELVTPEEIKLRSARTKTGKFTVPAKLTRKICWNQSA
jgi:hypothetical protein